MTKPGNCVTANYYTQFAYQSEDFMSFQMNIVDKYDENRDVISGSISGDVWITPSSKLSLYQNVAVGQEEEGTSLIVIGTKGTYTQEYSNDIKNFTDPISANFAECLIMPEIEKNPYQSDPYINGSVGFSTYVNGHYSGSYSIDINGLSWNYTTCRLCLDPIYASNVDISPQFQKIFAQDFNKNSMAYSIVAPLYSHEENKWVAGHQAGNFTNNNFLDIANFQDRGIKDMPYNYFYSFPVTKEIVFGDNTPVTVFLRPSNQFSYSFVGRYGEVRTIDLYGSTLSIKCDGEEVCSDYFDLLNFFWSEEGQKKGEWAITINNENIEVDGLQGYNLCEMNFVKNFSGLTPTIIQMQMRTIGDEVTDRFSTTDNALLTFYAGGFKFNYDPITGGQWFSYEPLDEVRVEYAPYGSDEYSGLNVVEDPDKFFMPGYGAYYYAELNQVKKKSSTGWYDVRISLKDSEGNTQVQTVSPAFFIDSLSDVETIFDSQSVVRVEGHDIIAPEGSIIFNASGVQSGSHNLIPGIYIVQTPYKVVKCVIR